MTPSSTLTSSPVPTHMCQDPVLKAGIPRRAAVRSRPHTSLQGTRSRSAEDMGNHRLRSCCSSATRLVLWTLLTTAACLELYDEVPAEVDSSSYQDENSINTNFVVKQRGGVDLALAKDVLLYRLIQALKREAQPRIRIRTDWPTGHHQRQSPQLSAHPLTDVITKRLTPLTAGPRNNDFRTLDHVYRSQQKWKIKKGKALGNQMVCYFKLCAFRSPL